MEPGEFRNFLRSDDFSSKIFAYCDDNKAKFKSFNECELKMREDILGTADISFAQETGFKYVVTVGLIRLFRYSWSTEFIGFFDAALRDEQKFKELFQKYFQADNENEVFDFCRQLLLDGKFWLKMDAREKSVQGKPDKNWKSGDIFSFKREDGNYIFGRILVKVKNCFKGKKNDNAALTSFKEDYLIEIYDQFNTLSELKSDQTTLKGVFATPKGTEKAFWQKVGYKAVELGELDFPELIIYNQIEDKTYLAKGELLWPISPDGLEKITYNLEAERFLELDSFDIDNYMLAATGKSELVYPGHMNYDLGMYDFRFGKESVRSELFKLIGESLQTTYAELAEKHKISLKNYID